jgi:CRP/FNR family transcriptional regulator, cyclic AMP receptor protein
METTTTEALRAVPLFADLDDEALGHAAAIATEVEFPRGTVLMERGLPGAGLFVILEGAVTVELRHRSVELGPGNTVGELSLLTDHPARVARVRAAGDLRALAIAAADFRDLLHQQPRIALPMLSELARRLQDLIEHPA